MLACKFGARRVFAVESSDAIHLARELARENGFDDRIEFFQDLSTNITLPEPATIIVSDLRGVLPPFGHHIPSIVDARSRHLSPGGRMIPKSDTLWAALVSAPILYKELVKPWASPYGLLMESAKTITLNRWSSDNTDLLKPRNLLVEPQIWFVLDYSLVESPHLVRKNLEFKATRTGTAYGWFLWFNSELTEETGFTNGPNSKKIADVYGRGFFPLEKPVAVGEGDEIVLDISAELQGGEYTWSWHTRVSSGRGSAKSIADFRQSTGFGEIAASKALLQEAAKIKPSLSNDEKLELFVLNQMDGEKTVEQIGRHLQEVFPSTFSNWDEILGFVYDLSRHY